jgi:hypothetical protein
MREPELCELSPNIFLLKKKSWGLLEDSASTVGCWDGKEVFKELNIIFVTFYGFYLRFYLFIFAQNTSYLRLVF